MQVATIVPDDQSIILVRIAPIFLKAVAEVLEDSGTQIAIDQLEDGTYDLLARRKP